MSEEIIKDKSRDLNNPDQFLKEIFKTSFNYYRMNWRAFVGVQIFTIFPIFLYEIIVYLQKSINISLESWERFFIMIFIIYYLLKFLSQAFFGSTYGLAYDILSSGDEFAEFRGFSHYFKRHWWKYILVSIIFMGFSFFGNFINELLWYWTFIHFIDGTVLSYIIYYCITNSMNIVFDFLGLFLFFNILPSVTAQGSISLAFKQNSTILTKRWQKILSITIILYLGYILIFFIIELSIQTASFFGEISSESAVFILLVLIIIKMVGYYMIILPLFTIIQTQVYNSVYLPLRDRSE